MSLLADLLALIGLAAIVIGLWLLHPGIVVVLLGAAVVGLAMDIHERAGKAARAAEEPR